MIEPTQEGATDTGAPAAQNAPESPAPAPAGNQPSEPSNGAQEQASQQQGGIQLTSDQLKERLDRAKDAATKELLSQWGAQSPDEVASALKEKREREEAQKSLEERLATQQAEREQLSAELGRYQATVKTMADERLGKLDENQREVVIDLAGDDPAKQLSALAKLEKTWSASVPSAPTTPAAAPAAAPASTGVDTTPPNPAGTPAPTDMRATWERLNAGSPKEQLQAASLLNRHRSEIFPE
jgi:predicted transcriptional regulator